MSYYDDWVDPNGNFRRFHSNKPKKKKKVYLNEMRIYEKGKEPKKAIFDPPIEHEIDDDDEVIKVTVRY